jgi:hypothetical protein
MYADGKGHMLIKASSFSTVVDAKGEEIDQGSMMRCLSEMLRFPRRSWPITFPSSRWTTIRFAQRSPTVAEASPRRCT